MEARFSAPVQTGPGAHPTSCTMGTGSFPGVKSGRGVTLTPHRLLVPWSRKSRVISLLPLWAVRSVRSLSACAGPQCLCRASVPVKSLGACTEPQCLYNGALYLTYLSMVLSTRLISLSLAGLRILWWRWIINIGYNFYALIVLFYVLFVGKCVLYYWHRVSTQLQLINISIPVQVHTYYP